MRFSVGNAGLPGFAHGQGLGSLLALVRLVRDALRVMPSSLSFKGTSNASLRRRRKTNTTYYFSCIFRTAHSIFRSAVTRHLGVRYFPMQKLEKMVPNRSSDVNSPVMSFNAC